MTLLPKGLTIRQTATVKSVLKMRLNVSYSFRLSGTLFFFLKILRLSETRPTAYLRKYPSLLGDLIVVK